MSIFVQSLEPIFSKQKDGTVEITFKRNGFTNTLPLGWFSALIMMMIQPLDYKRIPIEALTPTGAPIYSFNKDSHLLECILMSKCFVSKEKDDYKINKPGSRLKKSVKHQYEDCDPFIGPLGQSSGKFDYLVKYLALA